MSGMGTGTVHGMAEDAYEAAESGIAGDGKWACVERRFHQH